jgi:hypothetical protein
VGRVNRFDGWYKILRKQNLVTVRRLYSTPDDQGAEKPPMQLDEQSALLCELEKKLHRPEIRASADKLAGLLADEFFEFGASGTIWTRQLVIEGLPRDQKTQTEGEPGCSDFVVHWLADGVALVTYRGTGRIPSEAKERHYLRSSIWKLVDGQ